MKKTCSVNKKWLSFFPRFSLPARCKFIVLILKINFLWFWPPKPENQFPCFFENKALLVKTNHIRFLALPIPNYNYLRLISCDFDLPNSRIDFLVFFENKVLLGKMNHIRFLVLPIPYYVQNMKKSIFQLLPPNARCLLKVALNY